VLSIGSVKDGSSRRWSGSKGAHYKFMTDSYFRAKNPAMSDIRSGYLLVGLETFDHKTDIKRRGEIKHTQYSLGCAGGRLRMDG